VGTEALTTVIYEARSIIGSDSGLVAPASANSAPCSPSQLQHNQANQLSLVQRPKLELEPPKSLGCGGGGRQLSHRFAVMQIATRSDSQQVLGGWVLGGLGLKGSIETWNLVPECAASSIQPRPNGVSCFVLAQRGIRTNCP